MNNLACPRCYQPVSAEQVKLLAFNKMMPLILEILRLQGFEIKKSKKI